MNVVWQYNLALGRWVPFTVSRTTRGFAVLTNVETLTAYSLDLRWGDTINGVWFAQLSDLLTTCAALDTQRKGHLGGVL